MRNKSQVVWLLAAMVMGAGRLMAAPAVLAELENAIADVADKAKPSVVCIETERDGVTMTMPQMPNVPGMPPMPRMPTRPSAASGSGMIFRATADAYYILTNAHVVRGAHEGKVQIKLINDGVKRDAVVMGADRLTDTAVVKMDRKPGDNLPALALGRAKDLRVGSFVIAIGSPFHFEASVTMGIVSSLDRELDEPMDEPTGRSPQVRARYSGLVQTDASINPGNSGGPLLNLKGEVVGINFAIFSPGSAGQNIGIGFAIPIEKALAVVDDLIQRGRVTRGYLGVNICDAAMFVEQDEMTLEQVKQMFGTDQGAFVRGVQPGTPAAKAGVQPNDVIVSVDGVAVKATREVQDKVREVKPGATIQLEVLRDKKRITLPVVIGELPAEATGDAPERTPTERVLIGRDPLGLSVVKATADELAAAGKEQGVKITAVEPGSLAAEKGLRPDTILSEVRRSDDTVRVKLTDPDAYAAFFAKAAREKAFVTVWYSAPGEDGKYGDESVVFKFSAPATRAPGR
ncbi:MAG: trypsin-like peptidase domain-containing protein [Armatimonadetes bacterium]|nr:trypsin-like peptidase domain-containing protein [Armatimonadota bacterium]